MSEQEKPRITCWNERRDGSYPPVVFWPEPSEEEKERNQRYLEEWIEWSKWRLVAITPTNHKWIKKG